MSAWDAICSHGASEDEVRGAVREHSIEPRLALLRRSLRDEERPADEIEMVIAAATKFLNAELERSLPLMMRDMANTAGAAELH